MRLEVAWIIAVVAINVNIDDESIINSNLGQAGIWSLGDLNGDGTITSTDHDIWYASANGSLFMAPVPEPNVLSLFVVSGLILPRRRRLRIAGN